MGREIRRVALDFDFPAGETWTGFLNPHYARRTDCPACGGDGRSVASRLLHSLWYGLPHLQARLLMEAPGLPADLVRFAWVVTRSGVSLRHQIDQADVDALVAGNRLWDFTRRPLTDEQRANCWPNGWTREPNGYTPTPAEVNEWARGSFGHDAINEWVVIKARCVRYGVPETCSACGGDGHTPNAEVEALIEGWTETPPPAGDGWQLWQTVSEGGPVSPVFATPEELARWITSPGKEWGREPRTAYADALRWVTGPGWACSGIAVGGRYEAGVAGAVLADGGAA